jgi:hypothetical protein
MHELIFEMVMALNAADLGDPIAGQAAEICAEIAEQHCARWHVQPTAAWSANAPWSPIALRPERSPLGTSDLQWRP